MLVAADGCVPRSPREDLVVFEGAVETGARVPVQSRQPEIYHMKFGLAVVNAE